MSHQPKAHPRTAIRTTAAAVCALAMSATGVGVANADPFTGTLEGLPSAIINGPSTLEWTPSGRAIPVTYTNLTDTTQRRQFLSADATSVRMLDGAATSVAGIPQLARLVMDVGQPFIGPSNEVPGTVDVAPGAHTDWLKMLLPETSYGIFSRCTHLDSPQTISVEFTYYPPLP